MEVNQKKLNIYGIGFLLASIALPYLGLITPIPVTTLNYISYGLIIIALLLFGKRFWQWYDRKNKDEKDM